MRGAFQGVEKDRSLAEPYFFPIYEEAQRLDLPICIHTGPGSPVLTEFFDSRLSFVFPDVRLLPVMAFYDLACSKIPERFPDLRWGFIEANSSWIPYLVHFLHRRLRVPSADFGPSYFQENRLFVACEADEDLPYILQYLGEENMIPAPTTATATSPPNRNWCTCCAAGRTSRRRRWRRCCRTIPPASTGSNGQDGNRKEHVGGSERCLPRNRTSA